jgi:signal transduction histidine kinase
MVTADAKLRRTFVLLTAGTLVVFAAIVFGQAARLIRPLHDEILRREAETIRGIAELEIESVQTRLAKLNVDVTSDDIFAAVLESSRLKGVLAVQLFDNDGSLRNSLPAVAPTNSTLSPWWPKPLAGPVAQMRRDRTLEDIVGTAPEPGAQLTQVPLLEVVVPLASNGGGGPLGIARYWITGDQVDAELRHLDRSLFVQAAIAFGSGALLLLGIAGWTYRRLRQSQKEILARTSDLARANEELDFAAKIGALGAISAHLIHGLKNPLAGLEGFVSETPPFDKMEAGKAREAAIDTARRLRSLVNDVVAVLRDEAAGGADYPVPVSETMESIRSRGAPLAASAGVTLECSTVGTATLKARTANLAALVVSNLLANAIEASARGAVVRVQAHPRESAVEFLVADTARGLPEDVRRSLFRPLRSTKAGGGGMGLAISHRLARHAGGELVLERTGPSGTTFKLSVPIA